MDHKKLSARIADGFASLSPQLQRAARYVLDRPDDVALMSMRRLAAVADVHPSSMVRLAKAFGFDSYVGFRQVFQNRLRVRPQNYVRRARDLQARQGDDKAARLIEEMGAAAEAGLRDTLQRNGAERFSQAARAVSKARHVYVVGGRSSFLVAYYFEYALRMFRDGVSLLGGRGGTFGDSLRNIRDGDVMVCVGVEPYTVDTVRAVAYGREHGAQIIALTDSPVSPLVKGAEHVLLVQSSGPAVFGGVAPILAVAEILVALMVQDGGESTLKAIQDAERQLRDFDAYWRQSSRGRNEPTDKSVLSSKKESKR